jgi:nitroreductase
VPEGLYHYAADVNALEKLRDGDHRTALAQAATDTPTEAFIVFTGLPGRTSWKYAERGWRHVYWDAGTALGNLLAISEAHGLSARLIFGFQDAAVCHLLGLDGRTEFPLLIVALGHPIPPHTAGHPQPQKTVEAAEPLTEPVEFPLITVAQQAGTLASPEEVTAWRAAPAGTPVMVPLSPVQAGLRTDEPIDDIIRRRVTTRSMRPDPVPAELLTWAMYCATRPVSMDAVPTGHTLLTYHLSVHDVEGIDSGYYHHDGCRLLMHRPIPIEEARARSAHLCLDQPVAGDAAYTLFVGSELDSVFRSQGDRGYRAAQTEAGIVVGRLQLAATALGFGASGLTFFDDEVAKSFATDSNTMLACALGIPAASHDVVRAMDRHDAGRPG